MLSTGGWSITCREGLGKQRGTSPQTWGWIRLFIVPLQNICNYCTVFIWDPLPARRRRGPGWYFDFLSECI